MMEQAARAQRWMLWAAPGMALAGLFFGAGGAAAGLALWMGLGLLLSDRKGRIRLYPKQRRVKIRQLFLGYSFCVFCLYAFEAGGKRMFGGSQSPLSAFLLTLGSIGISLPLGAWAMRWRFRKRMAWLLTVILFSLFLLFILFHR